MNLRTRESRSVAFRSAKAAFSWPSTWSKNSTFAERKATPESARVLRTAPPGRSGLTLVEVVVLLVICGVLVLLLIPWLLRQRESARTTRCTKNQDSVAKGLLAYESLQGHFPGYSNRAAKQPDGRWLGASWVVPILPYLERDDLHREWTQGEPTAAVLPHGGYLFRGTLGPESSMLAAVKIGFFDRVMVGASFGIQKIIGRGDLSVNDRPGFDARLRLVNESLVYPGVTFGIDTQGEGKYLEDENRYERKSKGIFVVAGKNYLFLGRVDVTVNAGGNYSLENDDEGGVDFFGGISLGFGDWFGLLAEYDAAIDDNDDDVLTHRTDGSGYLDLGLRFDYRDNLRFKLLFKDLLDGYIPEAGVYGAIEVSYIGAF